MNTGYQVTIKNIQYKVTHILHYNLQVRDTCKFCIHLLSSSIGLGGIFILVLTVAKAASRTTLAEEK